MASRIASGCSKISFSMKWSYPPFSISLSSHAISSIALSTWVFSRSLRR